MSRKPKTLDTQEAGLVAALTEFIRAHDFLRIRYSASGCDAVTLAEKRLLAESVALKGARGRHAGTELATTTDC